MYVCDEYNQELSWLFQKTADNGSECLAINDPIKFKLMYEEYRFRTYISKKISKNIDTVDIYMP